VASTRVGSELVASATDPLQTPLMRIVVNMSFNVIKIGIKVVGCSGYTGFVEKRPRNFGNEKQ
jgi:hypothetical protein